MARKPLSLQFHCAGVTLIEVCATVTIIVIGTALALPKFKETITTARTRTAAHLISAQLASARQTAVTRRTPVSVCPTLDGHSCTGNADWSGGWLMYLDSDRQSQPSPGSVLRVEINDARNLQIHSSTGRSAIRFQPNGRSSGSNATIRICRKNELLSRVIINNVGRVRTEHLRQPGNCAP